jgi:hypothetical protein
MRADEGSGSPAPICLTARSPRHAVHDETVDWNDEG